MNQKTTNIIGWILTGLLGFVFISTGIMKLMGTDEVLKGAASFGLDGSTFKIIGLVELVSILLFIYPRTGLLGTILLAAYLGGAIATHLEHQLSVVVPILIQCFLWITAAVRFPELTNRFLGKDQTSIKFHQ